MCEQSCFQLGGRMSNSWWCVKREMALSTPSCTAGFWMCVKMRLWMCAKSCMTECSPTQQCTRVVFWEGGHVNVALCKCMSISVPPSWQSVWPLPWTVWTAMLISCCLSESLSVTPEDWQPRYVLHSPCNAWVTMSPSSITLLCSLALLPRSCISKSPLSNEPPLPGSHKGRSLEQKSWLIRDSAAAWAAGAGKASVPDVGLLEDLFSDSR